jgi:hypothetical protein
LGLGSCRRKPLHLYRGRPRADLREVIVHLHAQPGVGGAAERHFKPHRHFRRDAGAAGDDAVKLLARDAQRRGGLHDRKTKLVDIRPLSSSPDATVSSSWCPSPLVVIDKIDIESVAVREAEDNPPIRAHGDGPKAFQLTCERMKPKTWPLPSLMVSADFWSRNVSQIKYIAFRWTSRDRWVRRLSFRRGGRFWHVERPGGLTVIDRLWAETRAEGAD